MRGSRGYCQEVYNTYRNYGGTSHKASSSKTQMNRFICVMCLNQLISLRVSTYLLLRSSSQTKGLTVIAQRGPVPREGVLVNGFNLLVYVALYLYRCSGADWSGYQ